MVGSFANSFGALISDQTDARHRESLYATSSALPTGEPTLGIATRSRSFKTWSSTDPQPASGAAFLKSGTGSPANKARRGQDCSDREEHDDVGVRLRRDEVMQTGTRRRPCGVVPLVKPENRACLLS